MLKCYQKCRADVSAKGLSFSSLEKVPYCEYRRWTGLILKKLSWLLIFNFHVKILLFTLISTSKSDPCTANNGTLLCTVMDIATGRSCWGTYDKIKYVYYEKSCIRVLLKTHFDNKSNNSNSIKNHLTYL